ncbi:TPA: hypothetical protein ACTXAA_001783 [Raoultella planticola]|uniref:hypothetical protein n=1 Tax=Raoultella planticola TaxID=575 RepID=UPI001185CE08|nr:hypothetical protein [Raoultella planticola]
MFIEHSGFLLPRSVSRCRGAGWRYADPAYGWCIVLAGGAALTRPTVGALFWRRRCANPAYGWCVVLAGGATLTRPTVGALFWPAALS